VCGYELKLGGSGKDPAADFGEHSSTNQVTFVQVLAIICFSTDYPPYVSFDRKLCL